MPNIKFPDSDYPEGIIPGEFAPLMKVGKKSVTVDVLGITWEINTLEEWEERLVEKRLNGLDMDVKRKIRPVEILTHAIQSCTVNGQAWDFSTEDKKLILRSVLLIESPVVVHYLFRAYQILLDVAIDEFMKQYKDIDKQLQEAITGIKPMPITEAKQPEAKPEEKTEIPAT